MKTVGLKKNNCNKLPFTFEHIYDVPRKLC